MRQPIIVASVVLLGLASLGVWATRTRDDAITAAFWFDPIPSDARPRLDPASADELTDQDLATIAAVARDEVSRAFAGSRLTLTTSPPAQYQVRVVPLFEFAPLPVPVAGRSRPLPGGRGAGEVNFMVVASSAIAYATPNATRAAIIEGIGRGIGRTGVHELAHQLLPVFPLDSTTDRSSYEYGDLESELFYGSLHWNTALPALEQRIGLPRPQQTAAKQPPISD